MTALFVVVSLLPPSPHTQLWWRGVLSKTVDEVEREEWVDAILSPHCEAALANALNATRQ